MTITKLKIETRLSKLGEQKPYFSITGNLYEKRANGRDYWAAGGCLHEEILKVYPEYQDLVDLHLSDIDGIPMHALANGFHFYAEGIEADGTPSYFKDEQDKSTFEAGETNKIYKQFLEIYNLEDTEFNLEAFHAIRHYWKKDKSKYRETIENLERENNKGKKWRLINPRNNKILASHLRISLEEAQAIPAGLTKEEFNERYIVANLPRWKSEAEAAIKKYNLRVTRG